MKWLKPWYSIRDNPNQVTAMERELRRELSPGHPLHGLPVLAIGCREDNDDVLFLIEDDSGRVAMVHLTWTNRPPERPPWPATFIFPSLGTWIEQGMRADHDALGADPDDEPNRVG